MDDQQILWYEGGGGDVLVSLAVQIGPSRLVKGAHHDAEVDEVEGLTIRPWL